LLSAVATLALAGKAAAAVHTVSLTTTAVNGTDLGIAPGDVVCVEAGQREYLTLRAIVGTEAAPVTIKNCGGKVEIANADRGYGLLIEASSFFHLTGTGDPAHEYGFDVSATRTGPDYSASGVPIGDLSTAYEIDHVEVHHTGFAGFLLKTGSRCDGSANLGNFVQKNTRVHHTFVHDTGGEGFYVGSTGGRLRRRGSRGLSDHRRLDRTRQGRGRRGSLGHVRSRRHRARRKAGRGRSRVHGSAAAHRRSVGRWRCVGGIGIIRRQRGNA
jgi:hypothetical protein